MTPGLTKQTGIPGAVHFNAMQRPRAFTHLLGMVVHPDEDVELLSPPVYAAHVHNGAIASPYGNLEPVIASHAR